jgi:hypothetical protein
MNFIAPWHHGTAQFELGGSSIDLTGEVPYITFDFLLICPNCLEDPPRLIKNGHDTSMAGYPQRYRCKTCGASCMIHTSAFWQLQREEFFAQVVATRYSESRSYDSLCREYHLSAGQLSRILTSFWKAVLTDALALESFEHQWLGLPRHECRQIRAVWMDETFIKIQGKTWYLIVAVDSNGRVINHKLVDTRDEESLEMFWNELILKCPHLQLIVTDGLPGYERMCKKQKKRMYHIQHIHKDDNKQVRITQYDYDKKKGMHVIKQVGMNNNDLLSPESKKVYYLEKEEKDKSMKRTVGRPKGRKDTKKRRPYRKKSEEPPPTDERPKSPLKKRGRKRVLIEGQTYVLDPLAGNIGLGVAALEQKTEEQQKPGGDEVFQVFSLITIAAQMFPGIHITSNRIECCFSKLDAWQETRGRRTVKTVDRDTTLFLNYSTWQKNLRELVKKMSYRLSTYPVIKNFPGACKLKRIHKKEKEKKI